MLLPCAFLASIAAVMAYRSPLNFGKYGYVDPNQEPTCTSGGIPVCATNGNQFFYFENDCRLNAYNFKQLLAGKPELARTTSAYCYANCNQVACPFVYDPVCAIQVGSTLPQTLTSACEVNRQICQTKTQWYIRSQGVCDVDYRCPSYCPRTYQPVCAVYNNEQHTFSNECELERTICERKQAWQVVHQGSCNSAVSSCPQDYNPVCATFKGVLRTFTNNCVLNVEIKTTGNAWRIAFYGVCSSYSAVPSIPPHCPLGDGPVCASLLGNNKTFANACDLQKANYGTLKWQLVHQGPCVAAQPAPPRCAYNPGNIPVYNTLHYNATYAPIYTTTPTTVSTSPGTSTTTEATTTTEDITTTLATTTTEEPTTTEGTSTTEVTTSTTGDTTTTTEGTTTTGGTTTITSTVGDSTTTTEGTTTTGGTTTTDVTTTSIGDTTTTTEGTTTTGGTTTTAATTTTIGDTTTTDITTTTIGDTTTTTEGTTTTAGTTTTGATTSTAGDTTTTIEDITTTTGVTTTEATTTTAVVTTTTSTTEDTTTSVGTTTTEPTTPTAATTTTTEGTTTAEITTTTEDTTSSEDTTNTDSISSTFTPYTTLPPISSTYAPSPYVVKYPIITYGVSPYANASAPYSPPGSHPGYNIPYPPLLYNNPGNLVFPSFAGPVYQAPIYHQPSYTHISYGSPTYGSSEKQPAAGSIPAYKPVPLSSPDSPASYNPPPTYTPGNPQLNYLLQKLAELQAAYPKSRKL